MSAQPTPGPWSVGGKSVLVNAKGESIASGGNNRSVQGAELEVSLRLAAEAPTMLKLLRDLTFAVDALDGTSVENERLVDRYRTLLNTLKEIA